MKKLSKYVAADYLLEALKQLESATRTTELKSMAWDLTLADGRQISVHDYDHRLLAIERDDYSGLVTAVYHAPYATTTSEKRLDPEDSELRLTGDSISQQLGKKVTRHLVDNEGLSAVIYATDKAVEGSELVGQKLLYGLPEGYTAFPTRFNGKESQVPEGKVIAVLRPLSGKKIAELNKSYLTKQERNYGTNQGEKNE